MLPNVTIEEIDGRLGSVPANGKVLAVVGEAEKGTSSPILYSRGRDVLAQFGSGPMPALAAAACDQGLIVLCVRTVNATPGALSGLVVTGVTGTSDPALAVGFAPLDSYRVQGRIVVGGTVGTAGITYQTSVDGGSTWSAVQALGTANTLTIAGVASFTLGAGTLVAGDTWSCVATEPAWSTTTLGDALDLLGANATAWDVCVVTGAIDASAFDLIDARIKGFRSARNKWRTWFGGVRNKTVGETPAEYLAAMALVVPDKSSTYASVWAGPCRLFNSATGRRELRSSAWPVAIAHALADRHVNVAQTDRGPLPGVTILDASGNRDADCHDESLDQGLDDLRFGTLRSWSGRSGAYVTRPRLLSSPTSDFQIVPLRRVMNQALEVANDYMVDRLGKDLRLARRTGYLLEGEALEIERGGTERLGKVLLEKPSVSGLAFVVSRTDNLSAPGAMLNCDLDLQPLGYPDQVRIRAGFAVRLPV